MLGMLGMLGRVVALAVAGAWTVAAGPVQGADVVVTHPLVTDPVGDGAVPALDVASGDVFLDGDDVVAVLAVADLAGRPDRLPVGLVNNEYDIYRATLRYGRGWFDLTAVRDRFTDEVRARGQWMRTEQDPVVSDSVRWRAFDVSGVRAAVDGAGNTVVVRASLAALNAALDTDTQFDYAPFVRGSAVRPSFLAGSGQHVGTTDFALVGTAGSYDEAAPSDPGFYYRLGE